MTLATYVHSFYIHLLADLNIIGLARYITVYLMPRGQLVTVGCKVQPQEGLGRVVGHGVLFCMLEGGEGGMRRKRHQTRLKIINRICTEYKLK